VNTSQKEQDVYMVFSNVILKLKYFSRSHALAYTVKLLIHVSKKCCKIEMLLLQTTERKCSMAYWIV